MVANSREAEIAQGLRHPEGPLTFPLDVLEYAKGYEDFQAGAEPPRLSSPSYDLGRNLGRRRAEERAEVEDWIKAEDARRDAAFAEALKDRPDLLAEYRTKIEAIRQRHKSAPII